MKRITILILFLSFSVSVAASAQAVKLDNFLPDTCNYNPAIPVPSSILGYEIGEFQASPEKGAE